MDFMVYVKAQNKVEIHIHTHTGALPLLVRVHCRGGRTLKEVGAFIFDLLFMFPAGILS